ncbi:MAG: hypothetical protein KKD39_04740, partial [Candidatus Altiarchaeota archaeon]|nr:hypothetical protein [Candidatus Altiarchaeota archaeon]
NRVYSIHDVINVLEELKTVSNSTVFWTQVIVGFEDERLTDFIESLKVIGKFDMAFIFTYSSDNPAKMSLRNYFLVYCKYVIALVYTLYNSISKACWEILFNKRYGS